MTIGYKIACATILSVTLNYHNVSPCIFSRDSDLTTSIVRPWVGGFDSIIKNL